MYNLRNRLPIVWQSYTIQVAAGATRDVVPGDQLTGAAGITGSNVVPVIDLDWFAFAIRSDVNLNLLIDLGPDSAPAAMTNWITYAYLAPGWKTVYDMAAPYGGATSQGRVGLGATFFRLRINNPGGAASTVFEFHARVWHV